MNWFRKLLVKFYPVRKFIEDYRDFHRGAATLRAVAKTQLNMADVYHLAAVATELGVGVNEARDGTWRERFQVVDE